MTARATRIYLAGPEVFHPRAREIGEAKCRLCADAGFEGVFPLDAELDLIGLAPAERARRISLANEALIRSCDAMIANMTPFRGVSADAGTAFEIGFMRALGRPIFAYSHASQDFAARSRTYRTQSPLPFDIDRPGIDIEDFGLAENLMLDVAVSEAGEPIVRGSLSPNRPELDDLNLFERCLALVRAHLIADTDT